MSYSRYQAFAITAELGSLTKAADKLGYTQSGASHLIKALETELGFALLIRSRAGVSTTPEGARLLPYVNNMLASYNDITAVAADLCGLKVGSLRVGTFTSVAIHWIPNILHSFSDIYPGISITIHNGTYSTVENDLLENRIDCGFVTLPSRPEFTVRSIRHDRLMVVLHHENPLARQSSLSPENLAGQPFILPAEGINYDVGKAFAAAEVQPNIRFNVSDDYAAVAMVREGLGVTILPELMIRNQPLDNLRIVPFQTTEREIGLAVNSSRLPPPALKAFVAHIHRMALP